jgi:hypothetical protein
MIKSRGIKWEVHVAQIEEKKNAYKIFVGKSRRKEITRQT